MYVSQAYEVNRPGDYYIRAMREIPKELGKGAFEVLVHTAKKTLDKTVKSNQAVITVSE
jgi:hypothetical protein